MLVDDSRHLYYLISHCHKPSWKSPLASIVTWQTVLNTAQLGASQKGGHRNHASYWSFLMEKRKVSGYLNFKKHPVLVSTWD